tara:strand:- start:2052 stop:2393 length:342 start_codon:yes stop_codon:yes gene_type:complete
MHFCCNKLVDMSIIGKAKVCKDKVQKKDSTTKQCSSIQEKDCCSNQTLIKKGDDTIKKDKNEFQSETIIFFNLFFYAYINLFEGLDKNVVPFKHYRPPLLSKDIQILYETFLI